MACRGFTTGTQTALFLAEELPTEPVSASVPVMCNRTDSMHPLFPLPPSQLGGIASAHHRPSLASFGQISMTSFPDPIFDDFSRS